MSDVSGTDVYVCTRGCDDDEDKLGICVEVEIGFGEDAGSGEIVWDPANEGMVRIRDFSSTNRTWHRVGHLSSEQELPPYPIYAGDVIKAGEVAFVLFDRLAWSGVPADLDDQSEAAGDASGASSLVNEGGEGEDGAPQISPSDIFHARLEMLASQREAHAVPSAPAVPRDTRLRRLDSLFPELAVDQAPPLHGVMEDNIDGSDNLENGHMNNGQVKDEDACKVCYERAIDTVLVPCGHFVVCSVCVLRLDDTDKQCPICRTAYQLAQKIFK
ncbi:Baculoviral IAP repeat containing [Perkinsus olseni]|uniref:Baculoviral IAP repeat containing n=1 Tax=Perkinsus olseni TaxID=32597 RepID=A0A7J6QPX5_PEROL|nr:Baculoviral IAP repeat containing [Perkinsus olseni]